MIGLIGLSGRNGIPKYTRKYFVGNGDISQFCK